MKLKCKPRLFIDMDGTIAEWRNLYIDLEEYEGKYAITEKIDEILRTPGYFYSLRPNINLITAISMLYKIGEIELFILSCCLPDTEAGSPKKEKNMWLDKFLPEIDKKHRIFVPDGKDKKHYIPKGAGDNFLLDDYTQNLRNFSVGTAIKFLNGINSNNKTWYGNKLSCTRTAKSFVDAISDIVLYGALIRDEEPDAIKKPFDYKNFDFQQVTKEMQRISSSEIEDGKER